MGKSVYSKLLLLAAGLITGILCSILFRSCARDGAFITVSHPPVPVKQLARQQQQKEQVFVKRIDSLEGRNREMRTAVSSTRKALAAADRRNAALRARMYEFIDRQKTEQEPGDTNAAGDDCDSIANVAHELILSALARDSLANIQTGQLAEQVENRDSVIQLQKSAYQALKQDFQISLQNQETLEAVNKQYKKLLKRQQRKTRMAALTGILLTGLTLKILTAK